MPSPVHYGHVIAFTEDVKVVVNLQGPVGAFPKITDVTETVDRLYLQNLKNKSWGGFCIESSDSVFVSLEFGLRQACSIIQNSVCSQGSFLRLLIICPHRCSSSYRNTVELTVDEGSTMTPNES